MVNSSKLFECPYCDYTTTRKYNLQLHLNRKNPCKPREDESTNADVNTDVNIPVNNVNKSEEIALNDVNIPVNNVNISEKRTHFCERCGKIFSSRQSKSYHKKSCKGSNFNDQAKGALESNPGSLAYNRALEARISELENALSSQAGQRVINNTFITNDHSTNTNTTIHTTTNTTNTVNTITYNNFDKPNVDHITPEMIGDMYLKAQRELPRLIGNCVRRIYKDIPENDTIRFKYGHQAGFAEVRQDDETRILPVSDVLEQVLDSTSVICGQRLQDCCGTLIPGPNVENHAHELAVLHWGFIPETQAKRQGFFKFIKSALL